MSAESEARRGQNQGTDRLGVDFRTLFEATPGLYLVVLPDDPVYTIIAVNKAYAAATLTQPEEVIGRSLFEVFPGGPDPDHAATRDNLHASLRRVLATKAADTMAVQKYDIRRPVSRGGGFAERYWSLRNAPVLGTDGEVTHIIHHLEDVTACQQAEAALRVSEARQALLLRLSDALRPLHAPEAIKAGACRVLAERLRANRAFYAEIEGDDWVVEGGYNEGVAPLWPGRYAADTYGRRIMDTYRAGGRIVFCDTRTDPGFAPEERAAHVALNILGAVGVPLVKEGRLVAILAVHTAEPRDWTEDEMALVKEVAEGTWAAVERARAEAALQASEAKYRTLFESLDEGFCLIEMLFDTSGKAHDYRFLEANSAFERHSGLTGATGRTIREFVPNHDAHWFEVYGRVSLTGEPVRFIQQAAAMGRWFDVYAFRIGAPEQRHVAVLFNDISVRMLAQRKLEFLDALAEATRELVDPAEVMVVITRLLGQHLGVSRCAYADVEADTERFTILQDYTADGVASTAGSYHLSLFGSRAAADQHAGRTLIIHDVDQELAPAEGAGMFNAIGVKAIICCPLLKQGRLTAMMAVHQAVPRRWAPDEVDLVQATVERAWAYIERSRATRTLQDSNEQLARTNRSLEEFAYVASHDLQEPLRTVNIYTQLLLRRSFQEDSEAQEFAGVIRSSVTRMETLIRDLLSFSRAVHQHDLPTGTADLSAALAEAVSVLRLPIEESGAQISVPLLPQVLGDTAQLTQVFQNLLSNALKYRQPDQAPAIHISAQRDGEQWVISVRDNGIGFDPQYAERIFGLFKRLHRDEYPGTGVGLAICQRIIERYGGRMWAEGTPSEGATFFFALPATEVI